MDSDKALDRARKLLRLSASDNLHEAANAAAQAQLLMDRHRLDAMVRAQLRQEATGEDGPEIVEAGDRPLDASKRLRKWKIFLAAGLAGLNDCRVFVWQDPAPTRIRRLVPVGRPEDIEALAAMYTFLVTRIESLTRKHGVERDRKWRDGFRFGAAKNLVERLQSKRAELLQGAETDATAADHSRALALRQVRSAGFGSRLARVDAWIEKRRGSDPGKGQRFRAHAEAFAIGQVAAGEVEIDEG